MCLPWSISTVMTHNLAQNAFLIYTGFSASNGGHFSVYSTTFLPFFERKFDAYLRRICLFDAYLRRSGGFMCQMTVIAIIDNHEYVLAPVPVAPVNETDMVLLPEGLRALKKVAKEVGLDLRGAYFNLDGGFDSTRNRKCIFNAGLIPNIPENPRNRKRTKRGRKRFFNEAIHALRMRVERTFAWEDKFKRLLLRFERIQQRHYGMKLMAYTLINLRGFCGV